MQTNSTKTNTVLPQDRYAVAANKIKLRMAERQAGKIMESEYVDSPISSQMVGYEDVATFLDHMQNGIRP